MRMWTLACAAMAVAVPAFAEDAGLKIELLPGHLIYHESEQEAGVAMALSIAPGHDRAVDLIGLCEELRRAAGLREENGDGLRLETVFVVPYKKMAIEGYYWPEAGASGGGVLVAGDGIARDELDAIVTRAGIPPRVLDETNVEHEISCATGAPRWDVVWSDVRPLGGEPPAGVIARARDRFMAIHQAVLEHTTSAAPLRKAQRTLSGG